MDYEVEFRSYTDNAWYSVRLVFEGEKLTVKYRNFSDDQDDVFEPGGFNSLEELEEFQGRFRPVSPQLQDSECHKVVKGMVVCAAYTFNPNDVRFYDAIVDEVVPRKHSFENGGEECRCTFILLWQSAGCLSSNNIESMCLIQQNAQLNPMVSSFLEIARKKYGFVSHMDNPIRVSSSPLKRKSTFAERLQQGKKCAKRSPSKIHPSKDLPLGFIAKETQDSWKTGKIGNHYERIEQDADIGGCNRCHVVLINNLDKELSPSTIMEFIHKQTLVSIYAHVLPSSLSETFTSALIVSDCKENLEKLCEFLESPDHIITSARGRPWVVTQKFSWHDACRMSHEKLMFKSQVVDAIQGNRMIMAQSTTSWLLWMIMAQKQNTK
ncbi:uncharacterized protein LOC120000158 isoform X3 [Tripterygium wilfordii]|uniref:uncharacterized protein LOC120000158 isoform X3 n=1 Tax=Tripterygium wilfordii TaxID=458696 RepID=UPI0018F828A2|nr:uncharacterized protein LOC120000158 isoform X3 [Tripterygium wilfordii]